jgi:hypothetical protein
VVARGPIIDTDRGGNGLPGQNVILPGTFSPGHSPGTAEFGSLAMLDTTLLIMEIAGRNAGQFDHITVTGELIFDGILDIRLLNGFMPIDGDAFDLFDWGSAQGQFDQVLLPTLDPGLAWDLSRLYLDGTVAVLDPPITADFAAPAAVAAPHALGLIAIGLVTFVVRQHRRSLQQRRPSSDPK